MDWSRCSSPGSVARVSLNVKPTGSADRPLLPVVLGTALVLVTYVSPIATVAETSADLGAGAGARAWILSSMSVGLAAALLTSGAIGDRRGRRRTYLAGLGLLGVGALVCAGAQEPVLFVLARVAQGVGGAAVLACGLAALAHAHAEPRARSHATALWGAAVGSGIGTGSVAAAALDEVGDWRLVYVVTALAAVVLVPLSRVRMAESAAAASRASDPLGLVLLVMTLSLAVAALTEARRGLTVIVVVLLISSAVSATALVLVERRVPAPLLEPELMTHRRFRAAALGSFVLGLSMIGLASFVPTVALVGLGRGLWESTWLVVVWAGVSVAASLLLRYVPWPMEGSGPVAGALVLVAGGQLVAHGLDVDSGLARLALA
ncbi:MAG: MFS transporter, partial [Actinobacteria bacterium]|nr:MFS transporter [Actinomycetota bacterium]